MLEIEVRLLRRSVYFAGETIRCEITFTNTAKRIASNSADSRSNHIKNLHSLRKKVIGIETLAWASAQIHCQCTVNDSRLKTSDGEKESNVYSRNAAIYDEGATSFMPSKGLLSICRWQ